MIFGAFIFAVVMELIDASLGMMYGTILSPVLILMGYDAKLVVPSILISQAVGGLVATIRHNKFKNGDFSGWTRDTKIVMAVVLPGIFAVVLGVWVAVSIPKAYLTIYIGILVIIMGILCIRPIMYKFKWWKMWLIGLVSSFNKAISGGGFGPVTSTGKILGGLDAKVSVATTTFAEVPICLLSFSLWFLLNNISCWLLPGILCLGALLGGFIGPYVTYRFNTKWLKIGVGILAIISGLLVLIFQFKG